MGLSFIFPHHISNSNNNTQKKLFNATHPLLYRANNIRKIRLLQILSWWHWHCHFETNEQTNERTKNNERGEKKANEKIPQNTTGFHSTWFDFQFIFKTILPWNFVRAPFQKVPYENYLRGTIKLAWLERRKHMFFVARYVCKPRRSRPHINHNNGPDSIRHEMEKNESDRSQPYSLLSPSAIYRLTLPF